MGAEPRCCICRNGVRKGGRDVYPHGFMCGSCVYAFFVWKKSRGKATTRWWKTVHD